MEEYKARKTYDPIHSKLKRSHAMAHAEETNQAAANADEAGMYLFTTKTCPNCKAAKEFLKDMNYQIVDAEENEELSDKYDDSRRRPW